MSPDVVFQACSTLAMIGWIILIIASPFWQNFDKFIIGIIVILFAVVYAWLIATGFKMGDFEKFGSLDGVSELFANKTALTAGWVHYLAFDLFVGVWIRKNASRYNIHHGLVIPCLLFTFMLGPAGLLLYWIIRSVALKKYFAENY